MEKKEILDIIQEHISRFYTTSPPKYRDRKNLTAHFENCINEVLEQELDKAREEGKKEYLKEVELMQRFSSRKEVDLTRDEAFKRLVRLLKSKLKGNK